jgi:hypothetical protein
MTQTKKMITQTRKNIVKIKKINQTKENITLERWWEIKKDLGKSTMNSF